jgi:hypothetical protein
MDFIESILAAVAGFLTEPMSYIAAKIVIVMYPAATRNEILTHSNTANDIAAGVLAAIIIAWVFRAAVQITVYVVSFAIGLLWAEMKSS